jgi:hypothetical protein
MSPLWKLHRRDCVVCRTCQIRREANVVREEASKRAGRTRRGMGLSAYVWIAEIMSGTAFRCSIPDAVIFDAIRNPCKVGPFTQNRAGPLREIVRALVNCPKRLIADYSHVGSCEAFAQSPSAAVRIQLPPGSGNLLDAFATQHN